MLVVVGLGANLGDRRATLREAIARLTCLPGVVAHRVSSLWETEPVGGPPQPAYLNAAIALELDHEVSSRALVDTLLAVERDLGRTRSGERNAPRTLDLDLLWTDGDPSEDARATVPHPRLHERPFALAPLVDVVPDARDAHGVLYADRLARLDRSGIRRIVDDPWPAETSDPPPRNS